MPVNLYILCPENVVTAIFPVSLSVPRTSKSPEVSLAMCLRYAMSHQLRASMEKKKFSAHFVQTTQKAEYEVAGGHTTIKKRDRLWKWHFKVVEIFNLISN